MDVVGTSLAAAQTLFAALQCSQLKEIPNIMGYKSQLEDLKRTVKKVEAVLRDAETKHGLSDSTQVLIEELKDAVLEADNLVDEFVALAEQKQILKAHGTLSEKVGRFFSRDNPLSVAYRMSRGVKKINKRLDGIASNERFKFEHDPARDPVHRRSNFEHVPAPTCSYVNEVDIIGRQADLDHIVDNVLLNVQNDKSVSFLSIVGIGGLGKTALAQLIFNDPRVSSAFPLRLWTCVADQDQERLDVKDILGKILGGNQDGSNMEQLQSQLRLKLEGSKFLLVLDDVWTEVRHQWSRLEKYLVGGGSGSWIVVTTRSQETANIIGGQNYVLSGLSDDDSWRLFEKVAFASDQPAPPQDLVNIGRQIVNGCAHVPLAIVVAGSLVFNQEHSYWQYVQNIGIANMRAEKNDIMPILKLSYHHLKSPLKRCFSYCAVFPKDFRIEKKKLIDLWMAQSYIVPLDDGQSIEDAAEEYFTILLRRCFFQDIDKDKFGEIESCKIHDLMHDIAQSVTKNEICALNTTTNSGNVDSMKVQHLSTARTREYWKYTLGKNYIRSHLFVDTFVYPLRPRSLLSVETLIANCKWLRALDLSGLALKTLPSSIGELLLLRYLDLSHNCLVVLPNSITKLCNLQTLSLEMCAQLKELPKGLSRLSKLRALDIEDCDELTSMPKGMGKLTNLERLKGGYILGGRDGNCSRWKEWFHGLEDLKALTNLRGELEIDIWWPVNAVDRLSWREGLDSKPSVKHLNRMFLYFWNHIENDETMIRLMEELQPHTNLKELQVSRYNGSKMPSWATATSLPHLVSLFLQDFRKLEYLPLSPSLEVLTLSCLPKLKELCVEESSINTQSEQLLPCLSELRIEGCKELTCILHCPKLKSLNLLEYNERLRIVGSEIRWVRVRKMACINSLPVEYFENIQKLTIEEGDEMEYLPNCILYMSALQVLEIFELEQLKAMPNWLPQLTSLQLLRVTDCSERLKRRCQNNPPGEDWPYIQHIPSINIT